MLALLTWAVIWSGELGDSTGSLSVPFGGPYSPSTSPKPLWKATIPCRDSLESTPAIADNRVFATHGGTLLCWDAQSGTPCDRFSPPRLAQSIPRDTLCKTAPFVVESGPAGAIIGVVCGGSWDALEGRDSSDFTDNVATGGGSMDLTVFVVDGTTGALLGNGTFCDDIACPSVSIDHVPSTPVFDKKGSRVFIAALPGGGISSENDDSVALFGVRIHPNGTTATLRRTQLGRNTSTSAEPRACETLIESGSFPVIVADDYVGLTCLFADEKTKGYSAFPAVVDPVSRTWSSADGVSSPMASDAVIFVYPPGPAGVLYFQNKYFPEPFVPDQQNFVFAAVKARAVSGRFETEVLWHRDLRFDGIDAFGVNRVPVTRIGQFKRDSPFFAVSILGVVQTCLFDAATGQNETFEGSVMTGTGASPSGFYDIGADPATSGGIVSYQGSSVLSAVPVDPRYAPWPLLTEDDHSPSNVFPLSSGSKHGNTISKSKTLLVFFDSVLHSNNTRNASCIIDTILMAVDARDDPPCGQRSRSCSTCVNAMSVMNTGERPCVWCPGQESCAPVWEGVGTPFSSCGEEKRIVDAGFCSDEGGNGNGHKWMYVGVGAAGFGAVLTVGVFLVMRGRRLKESKKWAPLQEGLQP